MLFNTWANIALYVFDFLVLRDSCESIIRNFLFLNCGRPWGLAQGLQGRHLFLSGHREQVLGPVLLSVTCAEGWCLLLSITVRNDAAWPPSQGAALWSVVTSCTSSEPPGVPGQWRVIDPGCLEDCCETGLIRKLWLISEICCGQGRANLFVQGIFHFPYIDSLGMGWPCAFSFDLP